MKSSFGKAKPMRGKSMHTSQHRIHVAEIIDLVIKNADIILEILDSRFVEKTRNQKIEEKVKKLGKPLVYVFNKADLVNPREIEKNVELSGMRPMVFFSATQRHGQRVLMDLIKKEAKKIDSEKVDVGIIGYPNTGKSSLINLLVGRNVSRTSSEAGFTRGIQKLKISSGIYLIDTPGIIPLDEKPYSNRELMAKHAQIGAITWDRARDPQLAVHRIMAEYPGILEKHYGIEASGDSEILLEELGKKLRFLKKHGEIDDMRTAKQVLKDWQQGKIRQ
ncbi:MAG: GTPase [Candidatus Pacearchaeota archaeon]|jgi:ribosome biogenesis GTPase A